MSQMLKFHCIIACVLLLISLPAIAQSTGQKVFHAAVAAMDKGKSDKAAKLFAKAADQGNTDAWYYIAHYYRYGEHGYPADPAQFVPTMKKTAANPAGELHLKAMEQIGQAYAQGADVGWGVARDYKLSFYWYSLAAAGGSAEGDYHTALCYSRGVPGAAAENDTLAAIFMERAALAKNIDAMYCLGLWYRDGDNLPQNTAAAKLWLEAAGDAGEERAANALRVMNGQKPVYRDNDYRTLDARQKVLDEHPERRLTKADLPGGTVTQAETEAYEAWWRNMHNNMQQQTGVSATNYYYKVPEKTARQRDQEMYDKMHREAAQREKNYNDKWGR